ncbi:MAG: PdxA family dehydrogenase [Polyangiales bacterium]
MKHTKSHASPTLIVSTGDPGGVGPAVSLQAAAALQQTNPSLRCVLVGDADALQAMAVKLAPDALPLSRVEPDALAHASTRPGIHAVHATSWKDCTIPAGGPEAANGEAQLRALNLAIDLTTAPPEGGERRALVTAPMSKAAVERAGHPFTGHTEHLARRAGLPADAVTMIFRGPRLTVALCTTHVAIRHVADHITEARVTRSIRHLAQALNTWHPNPDLPLRITVTGLNPHAGESGLLGEEDDAQIAPAIAKLTPTLPQQLGRPIVICGPLPAESALRQTADGHFNAAVAMLHDQATIACKLLDWGHSVNLTWGLPYLRTSVDHGTAYAAARTGEIDPQGMLAAMHLAIR